MESSRRVQAPRLLQVPAQRTYVGDVEDRFFPILIFELELSFQDAERLERAWYLFRRRVSRRVAEPEAA